tara:strand:+ start:227 stop:376 length:150 start_codon:yes stop_codon:yes gene_type:complete
MGSFGARFKSRKITKLITIKVGMDIRSLLAIYVSIILCYLKLRKVRGMT